MREQSRPRSPTRCSRWLADARWDDGLLVPGRSRRAAADLRLRPDGVELVAGSVRALVPWEAPTWTIGALAHSRRGEDLGIALRVSDEAAERTAAVHRARRGWLLRSYDGDTPVIPLCARYWAHRKVGEDRGGVSVLLRLVADQPEARGRLASADVVTRLLDDIRSRPHDIVHRPEGVRRRTFEVMNALRAAGFVHPVGGRPLPGVEVADLDRVTDVVMARLAANPYVADLGIERDEVRDLALRHHCAIEPWPFEALLV